MIIRLYEENTNSRQLSEVIQVLNNGGIIILPTDTIYAFGCALSNTKGIDRIQQLKRNHSFNLSLLCNDLSQLSQFTRPIPNHIFKLMKHNLPGPFTFILEANNNIPKLFKSKKKSIGIRVPDNAITRAIIRELGQPIVATSIHSDDEVLEYITDPELIYETYGETIDFDINGC